MFKVFNYVLQFLVNSKRNLNFSKEATSSIKEHEKSLHGDRPDERALCIACRLIA